MRVDKANFITEAKDKLSTKLDVVYSNYINNKKDNQEIKESKLALKGIQSLEIISDTDNDRFEKLVTLIASILNINVNNF